MSTGSIRKYYTAELFHYLEFYHNCKRCGFPFASFVEAPAWVARLLGEFDGVYEQVRSHAANPEQAARPGRGR